jgi:hypothetical protein
MGSLTLLDIRRMTRYQQVEALDMRVWDQEETKKGNFNIL